MCEFAVCSLLSDRLRVQEERSGGARFKLPPVVVVVADVAVSAGPLPVHTQPLFCVVQFGAVQFAGGAGGRPVGEVEFPFTTERGEGDGCQAGLGTDAGPGKDANPARK